MRKALGALLITAAAGFLPAAVFAQAPAAAPPAQAVPHPEDIDPAVNTSAPVREASTAALPARGAAQARKPKAGTKPAGTDKPTGKTQDNLALETTEITGNRELPKVMVIVPWKHADLGELAGKPMNSLVDEVLQPIDRDVFRRQTRYYDALKPDSAAAAAASSASASASAHDVSGNH